MPVSSEIILPKTKDASEFEDMICDVCTKKYKREFQRYGRLGQKQNGVDIISNEKEMICVQCKNYKLSIKIIEKVLDDTKNFTHTFNQFVIATSSYRDNKLQDYVEKINREKKYRFIIEIMFWDEIANIIASHKKLFKKYYSILGEKNEKPMKKLVKKFNECINQYNIISFVQEDISTGIPIDTPIAVDEFIQELNMILMNYNFLQQKEKFEFINQFVKLIENYSTYLSSILYPANSILMLKNQPENDDLKKDIIQIINKFKEKLDVIYCKINKGCSLFTV